MNKTLLFALWGGLYALCAGLGFLPEPEGALKWLMVLLAVAMFVPPLLLIRGCAAEGDKRSLRLIRNLSVLWLVLTLALIVANFLSVMASETVGNVLYSVLVIVSSPMVCGHYWVLSLFGWAYLMCDSVAQLKKMKKR